MRTWLKCWACTCSGPGHVGSCVGCTTVGQAGNWGRLGLALPCRDAAPAWMEKQYLMNTQGRAVRAGSPLGMPVNRRGRLLTERVTRNPCCVDATPAKNLGFWHGCCIASTDGACSFNYDNYFPILFTLVTEALKVTSVAVTNAPCDCLCRKQRSLSTKQLLCESDGMVQGGSKTSGTRERLHLSHPVAPGTWLCKFSIPPFECQ